MTQASPAPRSIVVFDLGGVLIDWNPRYLYRKLFAGDDAAMEHFLTQVCTSEWNEGQDAGRSFAEALQKGLRSMETGYSGLDAIEPPGDGTHDAFRAALSGLGAGTR